MKDGTLKTFQFGLKNGNTYIDTRSELERENYIKRHLGNPLEKHLIDEMIPSPALLSFFILWGPYKSLKENVRHLNYLWRIKHSIGHSIGHSIASS